jgi:hypothetical protein
MRDYVEGETLGKNDLLVGAPDGSVKVSATPQDLPDLTKLTNAQVMRLHSDVEEEIFRRRSVVAVKRIEQLERMLDAEHRMVVELQKRSGQEHRI